LIIAGHYVTRHIERHEKKSITPLAIVDVAASHAELAGDYATIQRRLMRCYAMPADAAVIDAYVMPAPLPQPYAS